MLSPMGNVSVAYVIGRSTVAGKPHKPANQLQSHRDARSERRTLRVVAPTERRKVPRVPADLGERGKVIWQAYWRDDVSLAATGVDIYDIHRYCQLIEQREELEAHIAAHPISLNEYGEQPNPRFRMVKELTREIEKTREQLGILPLARMRLGLVKVQQETGLHDLREKVQRSQPRDELAGAIDLDELG